MAKRTVQDLLIERLDRFETKLDDITTKTMPAMLVEVAKITTKMKEEAKSEAQIENTKTRIYGGIVGGITLLVSIGSLVSAYFK